MSTLVDETLSECLVHTPVIFGCGDDIQVINYSHQPRREADFAENLQYCCLILGQTLLWETRSIGCGVTTYKPHKGMMSRRRQARRVQAVDWDS